MKKNKFVSGMAAMAFTFLVAGCVIGPRLKTFGPSVPEEERFQLLISPYIRMDKIDGKLVLWGARQYWATTVNMPVGRHTFDFGYQEGLEVSGNTIIRANGFHLEGNFEAGLAYRLKPIVRGNQVSCQLIQNGVADWVIPGPNETLVIFYLPQNVSGGLEIYVEGEYALELNAKQTAQILLSYGNHSLQARYTGTGLLSEPLIITADSNSVTYIMNIGKWGMGDKNTPASFTLQQ
ncbi:MAG: hypothetical protein LBF95_11180 [Treponema sp.]|jgi:hypothetical protein|nr:hypothetical protein [Treponema sp.]